MNQGEVYFTLFGGDFDPELITERLGIKPTKIRRKSDPVPKFSSWDFSSGKISSEIIDVYEMAEKIVMVLEPAMNNIISVMQELGIEANLNVVLTISSNEALSTPAIGFSERVVRFLAAVGAAIDVDTYRD